MIPIMFRLRLNYRADLDVARLRTAFERLDCAS